MNKEEKPIKVDKRKTDFPAEGSFAVRQGLSIINVNRKEYRRYFFQRKAADHRHTQKTAISRPLEEKMAIQARVKRKELGEQERIRKLKDKK